MNSFQNFGEVCEHFFSQLMQWERLRHPYAGWVRVALVALLPFAVWSHNFLFIALWLVATLSHPWWFGVYFQAGANVPLMTRMVDAWHDWAVGATSREKMIALFPCAVPALPLLCALWAHMLFWSFYFFAAAVISKILFLHNIIVKQEGSNNHV